MVACKLSGETQTTIPQPMRTALHLKAGDEIAYAIECGKVALSRVSSVSMEDSFVTFGEWNSETDRKAHALFALTISEILCTSSARLPVPVFL